MPSDVGKHVCPWTPFHGHNTEPFGKEPELFFNSGMVRFFQLECKPLLRRLSWLHWPPYSSYLSREGSSPFFSLFCLRKSLSSSSPRISKASGLISISVGKTFFLALFYDSDEACDVLKFQVENINQHLGPPPISGLRWLVWVIYSKSQLPWILRSMEEGPKNLHPKICEPNVTKFKFAGKSWFLGIPTQN